jgi:UDP-3-O-[3-hydroxymyristoyl] glucosamine N-acyltransferase
MNKILNILIFIVLLFSFENLMAQSQPSGILFQAVARDVSGNAAANRTIYAIVEIREATSTGSVAYSESHQVISNEDGIFNLIIGNGVRLTGTTKFDNLNWRFQIYFINLKVAVAPSIPTPGWDLAKEYVDMGTSQIWAVPYAFTAFKAVVADSAIKVGGIVYGENGGTGVSNIGKTITLGKNFEIQGLGNLKFTTIGTTILNLPISGTLVTRENLDTLSNKYLVSPVFIGKPKTPNPDSLSNDSTVANTYFVKSNLKNQIANLKNELTTNIDSSSGLNLRIADTAAMLTKRIKKDTSFLLQKKDTITLSNRIDNLASATASGTNLKVNISDTSVMLSKRFERDTISLSNRINLKVNTLNATIDSSLYVNGKVRIDSVLTLNDSLHLVGNALIDSNLTVNQNLFVGGKLTVASGFDFKDSLTVTRGARIDSSLLLKGKLLLYDSLLTKSNVKIDSNLYVNKSALINDSLSVIGYSRVGDSLSVKGYARIGDSLTVRGNASVGNNLYVGGKLTVASGFDFKDSLTITRGARIDSSLLLKGKLYVKDSLVASKRVYALGKVQLDSTLTVNKVTSLNDSLYVKGKVRFDSILTINDSLRVKGNVLIDTNLLVNKKVRINDSLTVMKVTRLNDSLTVKGVTRINDSLTVKGVVRLNDSLTVRGITRINDSLLVRGNVSIDNNLLVNQKTKLNDSLTVVGVTRLNDSLTVRGVVRLNDSLTVLGLTRLNDSLYVKGKVQLDSNFYVKKVSTFEDSVLAKGTVKVDGNILVKGLNVSDSIKRFSDSVAKFSTKKLNATDTASLSTRIDALSSGSNKFTADLKVNYGPSGTFGKYTNGQIIPAAGKTIDEVFADILTTIIHPTYAPPTASLSMSSSNGIGSGYVEIGANLGTLTLAPTFIQNRGGAYTSIVYKKGGATIASTDVPAALTTAISYSVTYTYAAGTTVQQNNIGQDDVVNQVTAGSVTTNTVSYTPAFNKYWGMSTNSSANITDADIINNSVPAAGGGKEWATTFKKITPFTITGPGVAGPVKYAFYAFPSSLVTPGSLTNDVSSIFAGGFESISAFDHITRTFKNASGYDVSYEIYVQRNFGTDNVTLIIN